MHPRVKMNNLGQGGSCNISLQTVKMQMKWLIRFSLDAEVIALYSPKT